MSHSHNGFANMVSNLFMNRSSMGASYTVCAYKTVLAALRPGPEENTRVPQAGPVRPS